MTLRIPKNLDGYDIEFPAIAREGEKVELPNPLIYTSDVPDQVSKDEALLYPIKNVSKIPIRVTRRGESVLIVPQYICVAARPKVSGGSV